MTSRILIGTSGFGYHDWCPDFYPRELGYYEYLEYYAERFAFVELNDTFFRGPTAATMERLSRRVPETFRFSVKLHRSFTHERELRRDRARRFAEGLEPLREAGRLEAVLAQFPFVFVNHPENRAYLCRLRAALELPLVAELRNESWYGPETLDFLSGWGIGVAAVDLPAHPRLPARRAISSGPVGYVRLHGRDGASWWKPGHPERYRYRYRSRELLSWIPRLREIAKRTERTLVVFNNRRRGHAVLGARALSALVERSLSRAPAARAG